MNEQLLVDGTIKLMQWVTMPLEHTPSPGSPQDIWDCLDSDGLLDPVKYNVFCRERAKYEGLEHEMFLDAMMSLLLSQCMAANEEKKETTNKVPRKPTLHDFAKSCEVEYAQAGFPGCIGSMDATHIACEKVDFRLRQNHLSFKLPYTSRTYNLTCNHRRLVICTTDGHLARWKDKSIQHFDKLATGLNEGTLLPDLTFELYDYDAEGNVVKKKYRGAWLLVDNGYLAWSVTMPPISRTTMRREIRWSAQIEAMRKDVECAFGILKGRWRVLKAGVRVHGVEVADKIFKTCVALHNWLLEVDGLADEWGEGIPSDLEGELGRHEEHGAERIPVPEPIRRLNNPINARNYDSSGMGAGSDAPNAPYEEEQIIANVQEEMVNEDGEIVVHRLSRATFRQKLITHFDIAYTKREIKWPKRNKKATSSTGL
ncbi:plant transposon protein [Nitzschia inconspicua]|uniref:Plant transposon protein n=1 Tax=Nitzschia inconspicua TaxID=303405 RepID=A0A9K3KL86_9STRA|nr:plant transposon protein [Nitzschia inconspicua]